MKTEREYLKADLLKILTTRYKTLSVFETLGVLEVIKFELIEALPKSPTEEQE